MVRIMAELSRQDRRQTFFSDAWLRLKRNKLAMVGLVMILVLFFVAIFAPLLAPHDPIKQDLSKSHLPPSWEYLFSISLEFLSSGTVVSQSPWI